MSNKFKFKVLGGYHYPLAGTHLTLASGKKTDVVKKGDIFVDDQDLRKLFPNRFELVQEISYEEQPAQKENSGAAAPSEFPSADKAGLVVKEKKLKGKGVRYFVYDSDDLDTALNDKSLAKEDVEGFIADYVKA